MDLVKFGETEVTRLILGSNPFSGYSHQGPEMDQEMMRYYTVARIKETLREAGRVGINTIIARTDNHVLRFLLEYRDEGGDLQWFAQTCPEVGTQSMCISRAIQGRAEACHIHGGYADHLWANGRLEETIPLIDSIKAGGLLAGIAGHRPEVIEWAEENLEADYYLCSHYNPIPREDTAEHVSGFNEQYLEEDRQAMARLIPQLSRPVIHYKIMAAGRNAAPQAFAYTARLLRPQDAVCVGVYTSGSPGMLEENVRLLEESLASG